MTPTDDARWRFWRYLTFEWRVLCTRDAVAALAGWMGGLNAALFRQDGAGGVVSPNTSPT
jgi:hypothetical protein